MEIDRQDLVDLLALNTTGGLEPASYEYIRSNTAAKLQRLLKQDYDAVVVVNFELRLELGFPVSLLDEEQITNNLNDWLRGIEEAAEKLVMLPDQGLRGEFEKIIDENYVIQNLEFISTGTEVESVTKV